MTMAQSSLLLVNREITEFPEQPVPLVSADISSGVPESTSDRGTFEEILARACLTVGIIFSLKWNQLVFRVPVTVSSVSKGCHHR